MFYSMQNVERKNNSDGLVIIIEAVSYLLCLQAGICAGFLSAQTNTTTNFVLVTIVTQINSRQKILKFTGGTHDHDWNIWEFKWSFICLLRNPTFQIYFQWRLSEKLCSLRGQKENSVWFHKTDKTFLLLVQLFKTRKKNSGATNSPVATAAWRCLLVYIVAAALLLYLCEKTEQKPLKTSTVSCFHNHQHPENTPLQCFTHTHTKGRRLAYKRGRFYHHKPQPFNGRRKRRRRSTETNYGDRNISPVCVSVLTLQQLLLASGWDTDMNMELRSSDWTNRAVSWFKYSIIIDHMIVHSWRGVNYKRYI